MFLSICIPTLPDREDSFTNLKNNIAAQIRRANASDLVEIIPDDRGKEVSIGKKRNDLYNQAKGKYSVQIDDDDSISDFYVSRVLKVLQSESPECIGYLENCLIDGNYEKSIISVKCLEWKHNKPPLNGYDYYRTPHFKTPIRTDLCRRVGVRDMRWSEDHDFAKRIFPLLKTEHFITAEMYFYNSQSRTPQEQKERFGL